MIDVLIWIIAVEVAGLSVFPLCHYVFPNLRDRGYSISKPLGILVVAYFSWILSVLHILPATRVTIVALVLAVGAFSGWYTWSRRKEIMEFLSTQRVLIVTIEAVFLIMFFGWVGLRAFDPSISHTEQPMDFAFLNASIRTYLGSPEDPWLRGEPVSYYYFGYWMMGVLSKLTAVPPSIGYNLSLALVPAMAASGMFGLVFNMVRSDSNRFKPAMAAALAAAILMTSVANLEGVLEFMNANQLGSREFWNWVGIDGLKGSPNALAGSWWPQDNWWWWRATRVIGSSEAGKIVDYTIHEFPLFSFVLGDLHPHVMSLSLTTLFLSGCLNLLKAPNFERSHRSPMLYATVVVMGLALGGIAFVNMWDFPIYASVLLAVLVLKVLYAGIETRSGMLKITVATGLLTLFTAVLLFIPYYFTFTSQVSGIGATGVGVTRPFHLLVVWGVFLVVVTPFILRSFFRTSTAEGCGVLVLVSMAVALVPYVIWAFIYLEKGGSPSHLFPRLIHVLPLAFLVGVGAYSTLWLSKFAAKTTGHIFALGLSTLGLLLIMGPELLYVDDGFGGANERMNTVFKLYYQGWVLLAAASGYAIYYWHTSKESAAGWRLGVIHCWGLAVAFLVVGALYYPPLAVVGKMGPFEGAVTLDGLEHVNRSSKAEYGAIQELRRLAGRDSAVLEAVGDEIVLGVDLNGDGDTNDILDYSSFSRISASTGIPTVLGWIGHENQWRAGSNLHAGRAFDVMTIYMTKDVEEAKALLYKYRVDLVYIGPRERMAYGLDGLDKFSEFMDKVFDTDGVSIYKLKP